MLTGKGESHDKLKGFNLGTDDYLVKPFDPNELMARIKLVLRRVNPMLEANEVIALPLLKINLQLYKVICRKKEIELPPKEMELLYFLASQPNLVFARQQLLEQIWGLDFEEDPRTVDVHIKRIRDKLGEPNCFWRVKTIIGVGYKFEVKLVNDLLDMAQIESGQLEINPVIFNLSELVRQVVARMEPIFVDKKLNVEMIPEDEHDIYVFADPDRIDQVIINLFQNAVHFSSYDRSFEVLLKKEDQAVISIRDYGPGIRQEDIQSIWERFYKVGRARTKKVGTGLGLSIVKHILALHKTDIQVKSEAG